MRRWATRAPAINAALKKVRQQPTGQVEYLITRNVLMSKPFISSFNA